MDAFMLILFDSFSVRMQEHTIIVPGIREQDCNAFLGSIYSHALNPLLLLLLNSYLILFKEE